MPKVQLKVRGARDADVYQDIARMHRNDRGGLAPGRVYLITSVNLVLEAGERPLGARDAGIDLGDQVVYRRSTDDDYVSISEGNQL
jgi:hypothetical protein